MAAGERLPRLVHRHVSSRGGARDGGGRWTDSSSREPRPAGIRARSTTTTTIPNRSTPLLDSVGRATGLPLVAAGGIASGADLAAALAAGASAAAIGSALLLTTEAGTSQPYRHALRADGETRLTRAFTGRRARGIVNRFLLEHDAHAPRGYPEIHYLTAPIRAAARAAGDPDGINLWAGTGFRQAQEGSAAELVERWAASLRR